MLLSKLNILATATGGVARLRELILTLAVQGKLLPQDPNDEPARLLLQKIRAEKDRLIAEGKIKRDKPLAEIAKEEKPFTLPTTWEWTRVADVCSLVTDGEHLTPERCDDRTQVPLVTAKNVRSEAMDYAQTDYVPRDVAEQCWRRCKPENGDVLMVSVGATLGRLCVLRDAIDMVLVRSVTVIRPVSVGVEASYLALHLMAPDTQAAIWASVKQSAQPCLYLAQSATLKIALPPLAEQARIVARVEELMRLCDALEAKGQLEATQHSRLVSTLFESLLQSPTPEALAENWQRVATHFDLLLDRPQAVDALEQTILQLAVRGLLVPQDPSDPPASELLQAIRLEKDRLIAAGKIKRDKLLPPIAKEEQPFELPVGWEWVQSGNYFSELCTGPFGAVIHKQDYVLDGVPLINPSHMVAGKILHDPSISVNSEMAETLSAYKLSEGDVVLARRGEVGRYALVTANEDGWLCGTGSFFAKLHPACNRNYLGLIFHDSRFRAHLQGESVGTTMTNLNQRILLEALIALPPLPEQARIVTRVTELRHLCADLRQRLATSQTVQAQLAEALVASVAA